MIHALVFLSYANAAGEFLVFGRLAQLRLLRRYKWFALWMAFSAVRDFTILLATGSQHFTGTAFWTLWNMTEPVMLGLETLVAFESYDLITSTYKGLGNVAVVVLKWAVLIGIAVSFVLLLVDSRGVSPWMFLVKRVVTGVLAVALMCVSWVFLWITDPIRPNVVRHCRILTIYLSTIAGGYFLMNFGADRLLANVFLCFILLCCLIAWIVLIRKKGEEVPRFDAAGNPIDGTPKNDAVDDYPFTSMKGLGVGG
jgi:hypothetical protein